MGFLDRLIHRREAAASSVLLTERECPHVALVPRWDSAEDIGHSDRVVRYECESCKAVFTRADGERLLAEGAERLRISEDDRRAGLGEPHS
jgi:transposase-like protein